MHTAEERHLELITCLRTCTAHSVSPYYHTGWPPHSERQFPTLLLEPTCLGVDMRRNGLANTATVKG